MVFSVSRYFLTFSLLALVVALPELGFAQADNDLGGIGSVLCRIVNAVQGNIGKGIATLGIVFLGIGAFFGKVNWGLAVMFAVGIFAIFGATSIIEAFSGGGECEEGTIDINANAI